MIQFLKILGIAMSWLPWLPFGKKVVEETVESIGEKEFPTKDEMREIVETMPGNEKKAG